MADILAPLCGSQKAAAALTEQDGAAADARVEHAKMMKEMDAKQALNHSGGTGAADGSDACLIGVSTL